jgi:heptosyltransferase-3
VSGLSVGSERRVLIIFPGALGDLICLIPAVRAIIAANPKTSVELMARVELARFAVGRIGIARAHSIDRPEVSQLFVEGDADLSAARAFFRDFAQVYSFFATDNEHFRTVLAKVAREARFYPFRPPGDGHIASAYLRLLGAPEGFSTEATLGLLEDDHAAAGRILASYGIEPRSYLLVLPGSGSRSKNWPPENFSALIRRFAPQMKSFVVLGPAEAAIEGVFRGCGVFTCSGLGLGEVAALARESLAFVGNDSGVCHLAAAAGAQGVVLFGPTDPVKWRPQGRAKVIRHQPIVNLQVDAVSTALQMLCAE